MRLLFVTPYFPPEVGAPQTRIHELAVRLARMGHDVRVLTTFPNYPSGVVPPEWRGKLFCRHSSDGLTIYRVWSYAAANRGFFKRIVAHLSFAVLASAVSLFLPRPDALIVESPPLFDGFIGVTANVLRRIPYLFMVSDLWPESAVQMGALKNRFLIRASKSIELLFYRRSAAVLALTAGIRNGIIADLSVCVPEHLSGMQNNRLPLCRGHERLRNAWRLTKVELEQNVVNEHFAEAAPYWRDIYRQRDVYSRIHQQRNALVLVLVAQLRLPAGSRILDVGCGSGLTTVALAQRGYRLDALDTVPAMLELTRQKAQQAEVSDQVSAGLGDAHQLPYPGESFHVVIAMGVTPFLHSLPVAMREMTRVVKTNGYVLVNADNCWRLNYILDPRLSPLLAAPRRGLKMLLRPLGYRSRPAGVLIHRYSRREFDSIIAQSGLQIRHSSMLGFGPFTFFGKELPNRIGLKLHRFLQECADQNVPILRSTGSQYIVLAQKLTPRLSFSQAPRPSL